MTIDLSPINQYYTGKITQHGASSKGVDWKDEQGHALRFEQFLPLFKTDTVFSLNDLGCGYGALYGYLVDRGYEVAYSGYDISEKMLVECLKAYPDTDMQLTKSASIQQGADYSVASGIFNVRLGMDDEAWSEYVESVLDNLFESSKKGFAFNCLTSYSDEDKKRPDLYYANALDLFHLCKTKYSRNVSLIHDYDLYEFTIIVRT